MYKYIAKIIQVLYTEISQFTVFLISIIILLAVYTIAGKTQV